MATMKITSSKMAQRLSSVARATPVLPSRRFAVRMQAKAESVAEISKAVAVGSIASSLLYSSPAMAAQEMVGTIADSDNRLAIILTLFVPALGWVGFNMLQPALNQLNKMAEDRDSAQRSIVSAIGVGAAAASMLIAQNAEAATQVAQIAESDNRLAIILTLFVPALGWVGFNMLQPALNQLNKMAEDRDSAQR